jgi:hypothetical protein
MKVTFPTSQKKGDMAHPYFKDKCICGVTISYDCYITNKQITPTEKMKKIQYQDKLIPILIVGIGLRKKLHKQYKIKIQSMY